MRKRVEKLLKPSVTIDEKSLDDAGFIQSGNRKFKEVVTAFSNELFLRAIRYSDAVARDNDREVSAENVYNAAKTIYVVPLQRHKTRNMFLQMIEHLCSACVGVGASNIKEIWGLVMLLIFFVIGVTCFSYRKISNNEEGI